MISFIIISTIVRNRVLKRNRDWKSKGFKKCTVKINRHEFIKNDNWIHARWHAEPIANFLW